jgi:hypothetical protein
MENNLSLSPAQITAIEETLSSMTRGVRETPPGGLLAPDIVP